MLKLYLTLVTALLIGDNGGISDSTQQRLTNGKATSLNSVEIKIVRTVGETLHRAVSNNGHFVSSNVDVINVRDVTAIQIGRAHV